MSQLSKLQADFQAYLMGAQQNSAFRSNIIDDAKVGADKRLAIYHDSYRLRLVEALSNAYPKLHALLGDELFDSAARSYIDTYPSLYCNLRWFGDRMHEHLVNTLPDHPITAEMAVFEWTLALAFDAPDAPVLQLPDLAAIPAEGWGDLVFEFQPSLHLLALNCNTVAVWKALDAEENPPTFEQLVPPETWLIWRREMTSRFHSLEPMESSTLRLVISGANFGDICASLESELGEEESAMKAAQYLAGWLEDGMIARV